MIRRAKRRLALCLALCAALLLCGSGIAAAATYEEGGGAAVEAEKTAWPWVHQRRVQKRAPVRRARAPWALPPSGKKPLMQKKAPTAR